jgi:hypothetical protein
MFEEKATASVIFDQAEITAEEALRVIALVAGKLGTLDRAQLETVEHYVCSLENAIAVMKANK